MRTVLVLGVAAGTNPFGGGTCCALVIGQGLHDGHDSGTHPAMDGGSPANSTSMDFLYSRKPDTRPWFARQVSSWFQKKAEKAEKNSSRELHSAREARMERQENASYEVLLA